jgi:hypothetical protein
MQMLLISEKGISIVSKRDAITNELSPIVSFTLSLTMGEVAWAKYSIAVVCLLFIVLPPMIDE